MGGSGQAEDNPDAMAGSGETRGNADWMGAPVEAESDSYAMRDSGDAEVEDALKRRLWGRRLQCGLDGRRRRGQLQI